MTVIARTAKGLRLALSGVQGFTRSRNLPLRISWLPRTVVPVTPAPPWQGRKARTRWASSLLTAAITVRAPALTRKTKRSPAHSGSRRRSKGFLKGSRACPGPTSSSAASTGRPFSITRCIRRSTGRAAWCGRPRRLVLRRDKVGEALVTKQRPEKQPENLLLYLRGATGQIWLLKGPWKKLPPPHAPHPRLDRRGVFREWTES